MLRYIYADQLEQFPRLAHTMFRDRAVQFKDRLGWEVSVDHNGHERDEYDDMCPLYVIWELPDGTHGGSMRFLPTTGRTMVHDHFAHLTGGVHIESPLIWECTRFCISPRADDTRSCAAALVLGAGEVMRRFSLRHYIGVFDPRMSRIYRLYGVSPDIIGQAGSGAGEICVGLWQMQDEAWAKTYARLGIEAATSDQWFKASLQTLNAKTPAQAETATGSSWCADIVSRHEHTQHPVF